MRYANLNAEAQTRARLWWIACATSASGLMRAVYGTLRAELEFLELSLDVLIAIIDGDITVRLTGNLDPSDAVRLSSLFGLTIVEESVRVGWTDSDHSLDPDTVPTRTMIDSLRRMLVTIARESVTRALGEIEAEINSADADFDESGRLLRTGTLFESISVTPTAYSL